MGYYTKYIIKAEPKLTNEMVESLIDLTKYEFDTDGTEMWSDVWPNYESEMKEFSLKYPNVVFTVEGQGEEHLDHWIEYWKNGKSQNAYLRIEFDEFDESKLK